MKRILLTSTALIAFAGVASAEVFKVSGDGEIGYNEEVEGGFYYDSGVKLEVSQELDNGVTAGFKFEIDLDLTEGKGAFGEADLAGEDFVAYLKSDIADLYFGDTKTAAERLWDGVTNMEQDEFLEDGDVDDGRSAGDSVVLSAPGVTPVVYRPYDEKADAVDAIVRADFEYQRVEISGSFLINGDTDETNAYSFDDEEVGAPQIAMVGDYGDYNFGLAYQAEDDQMLVNGGSVDEIIGLWVAGTFQGAEVKLAYAQTTDASDETESSAGIEVSYPVGPLDAKVFYVSESDDNIDDNYGIEFAYDNGQATVDFWYHDGNDQEIGIEGSYEARSGLNFYAGYIENDGDSDAYEAYVATEYDLGGGAGVLVSYGEVGDNYDDDLDEVGDNFEVNEGGTFAITLDF